MKTNLLSIVTLPPPPLVENVFTEYRPQSILDKERKILKGDLNNRLIITSIIIISINV